MMSHRTARGRWHAPYLHNPEDEPGWEHRRVAYRCPAGHESVMVIANDPTVHPPKTWACRTCHKPAKCRARDAEPATRWEGRDYGGPPMTPRQYLAERRSDAELEDLLAEVLQKRRAGQWQPIREALGAVRR